MNLAKSLLLAPLLAGCASLNGAGVAEYSIKPFVVDATGALACCEVTVRNGKEIAELDARIEKGGDDYVITLSERGVVAFDGQAIAADVAKTAIDAAVKAAIGAALYPATVLPRLGGIP